MPLLIERFPPLQERLENKQELQLQIIERLTWIEMRFNLKHIPHFNIKNIWMTKGELTLSLVQ